ncbi:MAG: glycosyltransferase family 4 protein [Candidatus Helarchaeota archaeon]
MNKKLLFKDRTLVLFFTRGMSLEKWYNSGLLEREIVLYNYLSPYFKKIYFLTYGTKNDLKFRKFLAKNIIIIPKKFSINDLIYSILMPIINFRILYKADIFKTNQFDGSWTALIAKILFKKKLVNRSGYISMIFNRSDKYRILKFDFFKIFGSLLYSYSDWNIIGSNSDFNFIKNNLRINQNKFAIIPNYVNIKLFKRIPIDKEKNSLVFVGRLSHQKNLFSLIKAISNTKYTLYLIGDGILKNRLKDYAKSNNSNVTFMGIIPHNSLPQLLNKFEIFVFPSYYEGMPKALIEVMACGIPVIASKIKENEEIIEDGIDGLLCGLDSNSIKEKIELIMNDPNLKDKLGNNAIKKINEKYSLDKVLKDELDIYKKIIFKN